MGVAEVLGVDLVKREGGSNVGKRRFSGDRCSRIVECRAVCLLSGGF